MWRSIRESVKRAPVGRGAYGLYMRARYREGEVLTISGGRLAGCRWKRFMRTALPSYLDGTYEPEMQLAIENNLKSGMVFYDVGANGGFFSLLGARIVGASGDVVAFEPHPMTAAQLKQQAKLNSFCNITTIVGAVSDEVGTAQFDDEINSDMAAIVGKSHTGRTITVPTTTLDHQILLGLPSPHMIKIDVEGTEMKVMRGALNLLRERKPLLLVELHSSELRSAYLSLADYLGYSTTVVSKRSVLSV